MLGEALEIAASAADLAARAARLAARATGATSGFQEASLQGESPVLAANETPTPTAAQLAQRIRTNSRIRLATAHPSGVNDNATAARQIADVAAGRRATRSSYGNAPGGTVNLSRRMLSAMLTLAERFTFAVSEIAGGSHSVGSRHYAGIGFDVTHVNGVRVNASNPHWRSFLQAARSLGATETLGPGDAGHDTHLHAAWPRAVAESVLPAEAVAEPESPLTTDCEQPEPEAAEAIYGDESPAEEPASPSS